MNKPIDSGCLEGSPPTAAERARRREELSIDGRDAERARMPAGFRSWAESFADEALERLRAAGATTLEGRAAVEAARDCIRDSFLAFADDPVGLREPARMPAGVSCERFGVPAAGCIRTYGLYLQLVGERLERDHPGAAHSALEIHRAVAKCVLYDMSLAVDRYQRSAVIGGDERLVSDCGRASTSNRPPAIGLKREALSRMSHELRTPLNSIIGFAELMHDGRVGELREDHREYLGDILSSARRMADLVAEFLDAAETEAEQRAPVAPKRAGVNP